MVLFFFGKSKMYCVKIAQNIHLNGADPSTLGISTPNDYTVVVDLEYSFPDFPIYTTTTKTASLTESFTTTV